jgi:alpha-L-fucosidase
MAGGAAGWWTEARFGLFIHWGIYAPAGRHEWVKQRERLTDADYQRYFDRFEPDLFDPREWAREARGAGMRYFVVTTKHHDGFCLWDSDLTDYKATNTPWGRDLIGPMVEAFRAEGLRVGFYHSLLDWHHPDFPVDGLHPQRDDEDFRAKAAGRDVRRYAGYLHGQVRELLTRYGRVDYLFFDFSYAGRTWGGKGAEEWRSEELLAMVRELQPGALVNDRLGIPGDFVTPEQYQPAAPVRRDGRPLLWEACQTLNGSWGYDRDNVDYKTPGQVIRMLVDGVAKDGNLLLNVGPTGRGRFDPNAVRILREVGEWMALHERSIRGCGASDLTPPPDCRYTRRGDRLYLHVLAWPFRHLHLPGLAGRVGYAQFLHDASEVRAEVAPDSDTLTLVLPTAAPPVAVPVVELFLE